MIWPQLDSSLTVSGLGFPFRQSCVSLVMPTCFLPWALAHAHLQGRTEMRQVGHLDTFKEALPPGDVGVPALLLHDPKSPHPLKCGTPSCQLPSPGHSSALPLCLAGLPPFSTW
jgi:hypothetical protein